MISIRKILRLRIPPVHSLPSTSVQCMSIPICNNLIGGGSIYRRVQFDGLRNYGTNPREQLTEDLKERIQRAEEYDKKERYDRERTTVACMLRIINNLAIEYLMDEECRFANDLTAWWDEMDDTCYKFWLGVCYHSNTPLAAELREKLRSSGLQYERFCRDIVEVFFKLESCPFSNVPDVYVKPQDVVDTINRLNLNHAYDSLKILFSLHKIDGMKI